MLKLKVRLRYFHTMHDRPDISRACIAFANLFDTYVGEWAKAVQREWSTAPVSHKTHVDLEALARYSAFTVPHT